MADESDDHPWRDATVLRQLYVEDGLTQGEIADELGCSKACISRWMDKHGIDTGKHIEELRDGEWLRQQYVKNGKSAEQIASEIDCSPYPVRYWLRKHDIGVRSSTSEQLHRPTTGPRGYERIHTSAYEGRDKVKHHRLVAIAEYGIDAVLEKEVHHRNQIPWDNRPANLTLLDHDEHAREHARQRTRNADGTFAE